MSARSRLCALSCCVAWLLAGCYLSHREGQLEDEPFDSAPSSDPRPFQRLPTFVQDDPGIEELLDDVEPVEMRDPQELEAPARCDAVPAAECVADFPRVLIVMDASSSMLAGDGPGDTNWDKARLALAGNPDASRPGDPGYVRPAFEREIEVRGELVTMEDVFHLGLLAFNNETRLMLQYAPCASDNIRWAMDPYVSCEPPGCYDPYEGTPRWSFKNSDVDRDPPFVQRTFSYMPPCNDGGPGRCIGNFFNTDTEEGVLAAARNIIDYREDPAGFDVSRSTPFALILITDGSTAPDSMPVPVIEGLEERGIRTFVIGLAPQAGGDTSADQNRGELNRYARAGGTGQAQLIDANEVDIADAFAEAVARVITEIGTDPCCLPNDCSLDPEPR